MKRALEKCGFGRIKNVSPGETRIDQLKDIFFEAENGASKFLFRLKLQRFLHQKQKNIKMNYQVILLRKFLQFYLISLFPRIIKDSQCFLVKSGFWKNI